MGSFKVGEKSVLILVRRSFLRASGGGRMCRGCVCAVVHTCVYVWAYLYNFSGKNYLLTHFLL